MMKRNSLPIALFLVVAACGGSSGSTTTTTSGVTTTTEAATTTTTSTPAATTAPTTTEATPTTTDAEAQGALGLYSVMFGSPSVSIFNGSAEAVDLTGYWLVQGDRSAEIPSIEVPSGAYLQLDLGALVFFPIPGSLTVDAVLDLGDLDPVSGELALFASDAFDDPGALVSYVEWGETGHDTEPTAIASGAWQEGWLVETAEDTTAITYFPDTSTSGETGWSVF